MNLTTKTPAEIDGAIAAIYVRYYAIADKIDQQRAYADDMRKGMEKHASGKFGGRYSSYTQGSLDSILAKIAMLTTEAQAVMAEAAPYEAEYVRRGYWTRFFLVKNNGGHIHSSMACSTCFITTRFWWLPDQSGQTEAEAVAAHGAILCTVCYPSAPTEWTNGKKPGDADACEGSGWAPKDGTTTRNRRWGVCTKCETMQSVTTLGRIRKHKTPKA